MPFKATVRTRDESCYWLNGRRGNIRVWRVTDVDERKPLDEEPETVSEALLHTLSGRQIVHDGVGSSTASSRAA
jgi:hypothetical protein